MPEIRPEIPADYPEVYRVNKMAFDGREAEPRLVEALRNSEDFIPDLSLVAVVDGEIVGHILFSPIVVEIGSEDVTCISLAPMAVLPSLQSQGIGSALVRRGLEKVRSLGYPFVIVLGHPSYYPRFGFSAEKARYLTCPFGDCGEAWMALELIPGALQGVQGKVVYPTAFKDV